MDTKKQAESPQMSFVKRKYRMLSLKQLILIRFTRLPTVKGN
jgi:hypothetical protein